MPLDDQVSRCAPTSAPNIEEAYRRVWLKRAVRPDIAESSVLAAAVTAAFRSRIFRIWRCPDSGQVDRVPRDQELAAPRSKELGTYGPRDHRRSGGARAP